jgi:MFS family permease
VSLLVLRLMLGVGESAGFPCTSKLIASEIGLGGIGRANGTISFGYLVGPAVGTVVGGLMMARFGWRSTFILFGGLSLLWLWPWSRVVVHEPTLKTASAGGTAPSFGEILRERGLWGASLGHFASNYNFYFILAWLPTYLVKVRGFSLEAMAGVAGIAYLINAVSAYASGWFTDRWIASGRSTTTVYKAAMAINHVAAIGCMAGMVLLPLNGCVACLFAYEVMLGVGSPGTFGIAQIMAGPTAAGRWVGIQNTCGNFAGILAPAITGLLVDATGTFSAAFALAALVNVLGIVGWVFILPAIRPVRWADAPGAAAP